MRLGGKAQVHFSTHFKGAFTLPFEAQWGSLTLPAGDYTLQYGIQLDGAGLVVVRGTAKGSPYGMILAGSVGDTSATRNEIVCIREGKALIVRGLEIPAIGESVRFGPPPGTRVVANRRNHNGYNQIAEAPALIQRIPIVLNRN